MRKGRIDEEDSFVKQREKREMRFGDEELGRGEVRE